MRAQTKTGRFGRPAQMRCDSGSASGKHSRCDNAGRRALAQRAVANTHDCGSAHASRASAEQVRGDGSQRHNVCCACDARRHGLKQSSARAPQCRETLLKSIRVRGRETSWSPICDPSALPGLCGSLRRFDAVEHTSAKLNTDALRLADAVHLHEIAVSFGRFCART